MKKQILQTVVETPEFIKQAEKCMDIDMPIFLFTVYGKNQRDNLSQNECNTLKIIIKHIVRCYEENDYE